MLTHKRTHCTLQATTKLPGSATACLAALGPGGSLEVVNLGDSGLRLVRGGRVAWASLAQEHQWNCPYQVCSIPYVWVPALCR